MLDTFVRPLTLPKYSSISHEEGKGNWAVKKYYQFPHRFFYRHKLRMITDMMDKRYHNILDYGSGPGVFTPELKKHAHFVTSYDLNSTFDPRWKFEAVVCASVLEFLPLMETLKQINQILKPGGSLFIASPMETKWTNKYFNSIGDKNQRHCHREIKYLVNKVFKLETYKEWLGLYFAIKATKR